MGQVRGAKCASRAMNCNTLDLREDDLVDWESQPCATGHQPEEDLGGKALSACGDKDLEEIQTANKVKRIIQLISGGIKGKVCIL